MTAERPGSRSEHAFACGIFVLPDRRRSGRPRTLRRCDDQRPLRADAGLEEGSPGLAAATGFTPASSSHEARASPPGSRRRWADLSSNRRTAPHGRPSGRVFRPASAGSPWAFNPTIRMSSTRSSPPPRAPCTASAGSMGCPAPGRTSRARPPMLNGNQGDYDLCIAVDPNNANLIYLGGDFFNADPFPGSIWRCAVSPSGAAFSMTATSHRPERARRRARARSRAGRFEHPLGRYRRRRVRQHQPHRRGDIRVAQHRPCDAVHQFHLAASDRAGGSFCRTAGQRHRSLHRRRGLAPRALRRRRLLRRELERSLQGAALRERKCLSRDGRRTGLRHQPVQPGFLDPA